MTEPSIELIQFPYSHYNEKARWALDWKRVPHRRRNLLPGPHALRIQRLTGQGQVPVVRFGDRIVHGSARILEELERRHPEPPLLPDDPAERRRALEIQAWFDMEVGPKVRRALFATLLETPGYVASVFSEGHATAKRLLYRATLPLVRAIMKKSMGIAGEESVRAAYAGTREGLDFVVREAGPQGYLVGARFSVADLTAASLLAPAVGPPGSPMALPEPRPRGLVAWLEHWSPHPGAKWVRDVYQRHRPASSELR